MSSENHARPSRNKEQTPSGDNRAPWERPSLRRLAANQAEQGPRPCNDGAGQGCGPSANHS
jgi:hypothetical protein